MSSNKTYKDLSEEEKLALRKQRFQFSIGTISTIETVKELEIEKEKIKTRQKRFGTVFENKEIEDERRQKRAQRFGLNEEEAEKMKIQKRRERFNMVSEEDLKKKRAERFKNELSVEVPEDLKEKKKKGTRWIRYREIELIRDRRGPNRLRFRKRERTAFIKRGRNRRGCWMK